MVLRGRADASRPASTSTRQSAAVAAMQRRAWSEPRSPAGLPRSRAPAWSRTPIVAELPARRARPTTCCPTRKSSRRRSKRRRPPRSPMEVAEAELASAGGRRAEELAAAGEEVAADIQPLLPYAEPLLGASSPAVDKQGRHRAEIAFGPEHRRSESAPRRTSSWAREPDPEPPPDARSKRHGCRWSPSGDVARFERLPSQTRTRRRRPTPTRRRGLRCRGSRCHQDPHRAGRALLAIDVDERRRARHWSVATTSSRASSTG